MNKLYFILPLILVLFVSSGRHGIESAKQRKSVESPITIVEIQNDDLDMIMNLAEREDAKSFQNRAEANLQLKEAIRQTTEK